MWILDIDPKKIEKTISLEPDANSIARAAYSYYELREKEILAHAHEIDIDVKFATYLISDYGKGIPFSQFLQDKLKQEIPHE